MNKRWGAAATVFLVCLATLGPAAFGQFGVGVQAPLALFGSASLGPVTIEGALPIQFSLENYTGIITTKVGFGPWAVLGLTTAPFLGGGVRIPVSDPLDLSWFGLVGVQVQLAQTPLNAFGQMGINPDFYAGLLLSFGLGVRYSF